MERYWDQVAEARVQLGPTSFQVGYWKCSLDYTVPHYPNQVVGVVAP